MKLLDKMLVSEKYSISNGKFVSRLLILLVRISLPARIHGWAGSALLTF